MTLWPWPLFLNSHLKNIRVSQSHLVIYICRCCYNAENCYKGYKQHSLSFLYLSVGSFFLFLYDLFIVAQILPGALIGIDGEQDRG